MVAPTVNPPRGGFHHEVISSAKPISSVPVRNEFHFPRAPSIFFKIAGGAEGFPVANIVSNGGSGGDRGVDELCAAGGR